MFFRRGVGVLQPLERLLTPALVGVDLLHLLAVGRLDGSLVGVAGETERVERVVDGFPPRRACFGSAALP